MLIPRVLCLRIPAPIAKKNFGGYSNLFEKNSEFFGAFFSIIFKKV